MPASPTLYTHVDSPLGPLLVASRDGRLVRIAFPRESRAFVPKPGWRRDDAAFADARQQLGDYFAGKRTSFDLPFHLEGGVFQMKVWQALSAIPYGETASYGDIARATGEGVAASRAVGTACGENPVPIVVPCHRVIGANGALVGFGGGLAAKRHLLALERRVKPKTGAQMDLFG
ncbi:MAG: methylated-DNA--[protein]-cysteine S-methyltransferase [Phyllobacteriaceae bacterium]|nr:methylated-DNA--[protein]-cysteine S-methyltransferase [Phyllobacteriaceae bacterium]